ncbi:alkaline phosphatase family protein [Varibaculum sp.]|uniref:alkaline phosphatase family protein n=1 Tax=Varibaculum sp. TaxID=1895474 RepID=UPI0025E1DE21|nr:nucleotide pyrophosphatase/phosphodiesterase family protein [Varibaculum sp.]
MRIWDILPGLFGAFNWREETCYSPALKQLLGTGKRRLCLVVIDGMGQQLLSARRGHIPFMRPYLSQLPEVLGQPLKTCVPSTTVAALTSLHTGLSPAKTGMLGYQCWDEDAGRVLNLITFEGFKRPAQSWCDYPTFFTYATKAGLQSRALVPPDFVGSTLSEITLRDADFKVSTELSKRASDALQAFKQGVDYVYLYWSGLDHWGHNLGWSHPRWIQELESVDRFLSDLHSCLPGDVALVVTADHGMVNVSVDTTVDIAESGLASQVEAVSGEPRALHIRLRGDCLEDHPSGNHTRSAPRTSVTAKWQEYVGKRGQVVSDYRPVYGDILLPERIGDFTIFAKGNYQFVDTRFHNPSVLQMVGVHGALTPQEMEIPLIIA